MQVVVQLHQDDLKEAVCEYMKNRGWDVDSKSVRISTLIGDRNDPDTYMATATCVKCVRAP